MSTRLNARMSGYIIEAASTTYVNCEFHGCRFVGVIEPIYDTCSFHYCDLSQVPAGCLRGCTIVDDLPDGIGS